MKYAYVCRVAYWYGLMSVSRSKLTSSISLSRSKLGIKFDSKAESRTGSWPSSFSLTRISGAYHKSWSRTRSGRK
jgi:hypothetical protein